jgi:hypothetical protein
MSRGFDAEKSREWQGRFERYRSSEVSVGRFCANEGVSVNTFYYWSRRVGPLASVTRAETEPERMTTNARGTRESVSVAPLGMVRFRLSAAVEVLVPANCLAAIRCLADSVREPRTEGSGGFHEVVLGNR